ncbi:MAG: HAD family hydrolase [Firmicutes bacterium]|nr:HAD family hydrolase [Bacillota bacterium]
MSLVLEDVEWLFFDIDGTLLRTDQIAVKAYQEVIDQLRQERLWDGEIPTVADICSSFGYPIDEIWRRLLPEADPQIRQEAARRAWKVEQQRLAHGEGQLFEGVQETLTVLHARGYRLATASNCNLDYLTFLERRFALRRWFDRLACSGGYQVSSKTALVAQLLQECQTHAAVMIGDRKTDIDAAHQNGIVAIGCAFGFGDAQELAEADIVIERFQELLTLLPGLSSDDVVPVVKSEVTWTEKGME